MTIHRLDFVCELRHGLHARPASRLAEVARTHDVQITIVGPGGSADVKSVLSVIGLNVRQGDACILLVEGPDANLAQVSLHALIAQRFGEPAEEEDAGDPASAAAHHGRLPAGLARHYSSKLPALFAGSMVSPGESPAEGAVVVLGAFDLALVETPRPTGPRQAEHEALARAIDRVHHQMTSPYAGGHEERVADEIRAAHAAMLEDEALVGEVRRRIDEGESAASAVKHAALRAAERLRTTCGAYVQQRAADVQEVGGQLLEQLLGRSLIPPPPALTAPSIVVARTITTSQLSALGAGEGARHLKALVLGPVARTSHAAIIARARAVPALAGADVPAVGLHNGKPALLDPDAAILIAEPDEVCRRYYAFDALGAACRRRKREAAVHRAPRTGDGRTLHVAGNAGSPADVALAVEHGADGIGLLRTELLFLDRHVPPTEDEQFEVYAAAVRAARGRPVIVRTLDIGGDKPAPYLPMPREQNPFLGVRGVRLWRVHRALREDQLRALCRASALGPLWVMAPMVATEAEAKWFREEVAAAQAACRAAGQAVDPGMRVGVMIEVPSAAAGVERLARHADFFSIGTNDLAQYFFAADRTGAAPALATLNDPDQPAFVALLADICRRARAAGRWVGICGEMAGDVARLPLMLSIGVNEISVSPPQIPALRAALAELDASAYAGLAAELAEAPDAPGVRSGLARAMAQRVRPVIEPALVLDGLEARSKAEVIRALAGAVVAAGRADSRAALEHAVWAREDTYATSVGHGVAIPHSPRAAVGAPTVAVARLAGPVAWGKDGGGEESDVRLVMLLLIPEGSGKDHLRVLATLARKLMNDEFRDGLFAAPTPEAVSGLVLSALTPP